MIENIIFFSALLIAVLLCLCTMPVVTVTSASNTEDEDPGWIDVTDEYESLKND